MEKERCCKGCLKENKIKSFPQGAPLPSSRYSPYGRMRDIRGAIKNFAAPIPRIRPYGEYRGDEARRGGFTLIELLVVVLIIGILAAVAVPQYQKVVERARAAQVLPLLKAVAQAYASYHLANGTYATSFEELPVDIEWTGRDIGYHHYSDVRSNEDWSLQLSLVGVAGITQGSVFVTRLRGPYRGGGFILYTKTQELFCAERPIFTNTPGSYCEKIFKGTNTGISADTKTYYLP